MSFEKGDRIKFGDGNKVIIGSIEDIGLNKVVVRWDKYPQWTYLYDIPDLAQTVTILPKFEYEIVETGIV